MSDPDQLAPFHFNEGFLQLPVTWRDLTLSVLSAADNDSSGTSFTVSRDMIPWGMTFAQFAEREISSIASQLKDYQPVGQENGVLDNRDTVTSEFIWSSPQGKIHQLMLLLDLAPKVLIFTGTVPGSMRAEQRDQLSALMKTFRLRDVTSDLAQTV